MESNYDEEQWKRAIENATLSTLLREREHLEVLKENNGPDVDIMSIAMRYKPETAPEHAEHDGVVDFVYDGNPLKSTMWRWEDEDGATHSVFSSFEAPENEFSTTARETNYNAAAVRLNSLNKRISQVTTVTSIL